MSELGPDDIPLVFRASLKCRDRDEVDAFSVAVEFTNDIPPEWIGRRLGEMLQAFLISRFADPKFDRAAAVEEFAKALHVR